MKKNAILIAGYLLLSPYAFLQGSDVSFVLKLQADSATSQIAEGAEQTRERIDLLGKAVVEGELPRIKDLLSKNTPVNARYSAVEAGEEITGLTLFHLASHAPIANQAEVVAELVLRNVPVNEVDSKGMSPLHYAILWQADDVLEALVQIQGISFSTLDCLQRTPLHIAAFMGSEVALNLLIPHGSLDAVDKEGNTPMHLAALKGNKGCVTALQAAGAPIDSKNALKRTPLFLAVMHMEFPVIMELLKHGADPYVEDSEGKIPNTYWIEKGLIIMPRNENPPSTVRKWAEESKRVSSALKQTGPSTGAKMFTFLLGAGVSAAAVICYLKYMKNTDQ